MIFYLLILLFLLFLPNNKRGVIWFVFIIGGVSALRYDVGYDYINYLNIIEGKYNYETDYERIEWLPKLLIEISRTLQEPQFFFAITSIIIIVGISYWVNKETTEKKLSILMFMSMPMFFWASLSIIRQFVAVSFGVLFFYYLHQEKKKKEILFLILAIISHSSAWVLLIAYIAKYKQILKIGIPIYICSFFIGEVFPIVFSWGTGVGLFDKAQLFLGKHFLKGFQSQIILFNILFLFFWFVLRSKKNDSKADFYSALLLLGMCLFNGLFFVPVFAGRISTYFLITLIILYPNSLKVKRYSILGRVVIILTSVFLYIYTLHLSSSSFEQGLTIKDAYIPYKTFFQK